MCNSLTNVFIHVLVTMCETTVPILPNNIFLHKLQIFFSQNLVFSIDIGLKQNKLHQTFKHKPFNYSHKAKASAAEAAAAEGRQNFGSGSD